MDRREKWNLYISERKTAKARRYYSRGTAGREGEDRGIREAYFREKNPSSHAAQCSFE